MDTKVCCIKECDNIVVALGLCVNHWRRNRAYGSPVALKSHSGQFRNLLATERFEKQVQKSESCWTWIGGRDKDGYGCFKGDVAGVIFTRAHRYSYALHTGDLLIGRQALHSCDNPSCVNPEHLFSGTPLDNMKDKISKGRAQVPFGENTSRAILTEVQAQSILIDPRTYSAIAAEYNVSASTIGSLKKRHSWAHLKGETVMHKRIGQQGESSYAAKITAEDVLFIRASSDSGKALAVKFGISPQSITDIRKLRSWKHVF